MLSWACLNHFFFGSFFSYFGALIPKNYFKAGIFSTSTAVPPSKPLSSTPLTIENSLASNLKWGFSSRTI